MNFKLLIGPIVTVIVAGAYLALYSPLKQEDTFTSQIQAKVNAFIPYKVNDCEVIMKQQNLTYALCTMVGDGKVVLHDDKLNCGVQLKSISSCGKISYSTEFRQGDYLGLQVNLQELNDFYSSYFACVSHNFPVFETAYPQQYGAEASASKVVSQDFLCSTLLSQKDYHHAALSGFLLNKPGKYSFKIWLFNGVIGNINFKNNLDKGKLVFELVGEIK